MRQEAEKTETKNEDRIIHIAKTIGVSLSKTISVTDEELKQIALTESLIQGDRATGIALARQQVLTNYKNSPNKLVDEDIPRLWIIPSDKHKKAKESFGILDNQEIFFDPAIGSVVLWNPDIMLYSEFIRHVMLAFTLGVCITEFTVLQAPNSDGFRSRLTRSGLFYHTLQAENGGFVEDYEWFLEVATTAYDSFLFMDEVLSSEIKEFDADRYFRWKLMEQLRAVGLMNNQGYVQVEGNFVVPYEFAQIRRDRCTLQSSPGTYSDWLYVDGPKIMAAIVWKEILSKLDITQQRTIIKDLRTARRSKEHPDNNELIALARDFVDKQWGAGMFDNLSNLPWVGSDEDMVYRLYEVLHCLLPRKNFQIEWEETGNQEQSLTTIVQKEYPDDTEWEITEIIEEYEMCIQKRAVGDAPLSFSHQISFRRPGLLEEDNIWHSHHGLVIADKDMHKAADIAKRGGKVIITQLARCNEALRPFLMDQKLTGDVRFGMKLAHTEIARHHIGNVPQVAIIHIDDRKDALAVLHGIIGDYYKWDATDYRLFIHPGLAVVFKNEQVLNTDLLRDVYTALSHSSAFSVSVVSENLAYGDSEIRIEPALLGMRSTGKYTDLPSAWFFDRAFVAWDSFRFRHILLSENTVKFPFDVRMYNLLRKSLYKAGLLHYGKLASIRSGERTILVPLSYLSIAKDKFQQRKSPSECVVLDVDGAAAWALHNILGHFSVPDQDKILTSLNRARQDSRGDAFALIHTMIDNKFGPGTFNTLHQLPFGTTDDQTIAALVDLALEYSPEGRRGRVSRRLLKHLRSILYTTPQEF